LWREPFSQNPVNHRRYGSALLSALIAARRQSYEALAHCTVPVAGLRELSLGSKTPLHQPVNDF